MITRLLRPDEAWKADIAKAVAFEFGIDIEKKKEEETRRYFIMKGFFKFVGAVVAIFAAVVGLLMIFDRFTQKNRIKERHSVTVK